MTDREAMRGTAEFSALSEDLRRVLEDTGTWQTVKAGEELFALGDTGDSMYVVAEGHLQSLVPGAGGEAPEIVISELGPEPIPSRRFSAAALGRALDEIDASPVFRRRLDDLSRVLAYEDGADAAADIIEEAMEGAAMQVPERSM